jgi:Flp pilus assembly protein TadD
MNRRERRFAAKQNKAGGAGADLSAQHEAARAAIARGGWAEAEAAYRQLLIRAPHDARVLNDLGNLARLQGRLDEALDRYRQAIAAQPGLADAHNNLGATLLTLARFEDALAAFQQALALQPAFAAAIGNAGVALRELGRLDEAEAGQRRALALRPGHGETLANLGVVLRDQGRLTEAIAAFDQALSQTPGNADARKNRALAHLAAGHFAPGWADHAWRWRSRGFDSPRRDRGLPEWTGGRGRVLAWGEQGIGDRILLAGMLADLHEVAGDVAVETEPRLVPLLARSFPALEILPEGEPPAGGGFTSQIALGALGQHFRKQPDAFPSRRAYLRADSVRTAALRHRYTIAPDQLLVGISWRSRNAAFGRFKSAGLADWAPILAVPGVTFVNLQYGDTRDERSRIEAPHILHDATIDPLRDLDGAAAQIAAMDLVITTSNTTAHMAGALGIETWTLLPSGPGLLWYWFQDREDSPWYPAMRLCRQLAPGDWVELITRVAAELHRHAARRDNHSEKT